MKDSEIPAFTSKLLDVCVQASKGGRYLPPEKMGSFNNRCCPLLILEKELGIGAGALATSGLTGQEVCGFTRGYDGRLVEDGDERFYILGQGFRKIAHITGFR